MSWTETVERYLAEGLSVSGGKEDERARAQATKTFDTASGAATSRNATASKYEGQAENATKDWLTGKVGFDPAKLAVMIAQFQNQVSSEKSDVGANVRAALASRGGAPSDTPAGGDYARSLEGLEGMFATARSSGIANIKIQDLMQALNNKQFAVNLRAGMAGQAGNQAVGWGSVMNGATKNTIDSYHPSPLYDSLLKPIASGVGQGLGTVVGKMPVCHIAIALYGPLDIRVLRARVRLYAWRNRSLLGRSVVGLYARFGERLAKYPTIVHMFRPLFDRLVA